MNTRTSRLEIGFQLTFNSSVIIRIIQFPPLIINRTVRISTSRRTIQSLRYTCHCCTRHCAAVVVSLSSAETRPSIRAVQRCFVRSNSISEFLYRDPPHFQTDPGPVRSPLPAQSQKHAQHARGMGTNPHSLTPSRWL